MAHFDQRLFDRFGHPEEHLDLVIAGPQAELFRGADRVRHAADVVRAERGINVLVAQQHPARDALEIRVRLRLLQIHRHRPAALAGNDRFVVPIRAFDEPHGQPALLALCPGEKVFEIFGGIGEIRLDDQPGVVPVSELRLFEDALEEIKRQPFQRVVLHVQIDEHAEFLRASEQRPQPVLQPRNGYIRVSRMNLRIKRADLYRHVHLRDRLAAAARGTFELLVVRPLLRLRREAFDELQVAVEIFVRLALAHYGLAENVHGEADRAVAQFAQHRHRVRPGAAGDELPRHAAGAEAHRARRQTGRELRQVQPEPERTRQCGFLAAEIFAHVRDDTLPGAQARQHVNKAQRLDFQRFVGHGPLHHLAQPEGGIDGVRDLFLTVGAVENRLANGFDSGLGNQRGVGGNGRHRAS